MKKNEGLNLPVRLVESGLAGVDFDATQVVHALSVGHHCRGQRRRYMYLYIYISIYIHHIV